MNPMMQGLKSANSMMSMNGMEEMNEMGSDNTSAADLIQQAITLHEGHISGQVPTDEQSQMQLMDLLNQALSALNGPEGM